ncbi:glycosyltransferase family 39 protein [Paracoccus sp. SCSIO 75233]|uniref:ArnT family glycosyltransferase n=1 Tax=Paracoccus sp. SCSIO 75233 TaxID=3017782 RepID=UPI0022F113EA|nr:glycosyltransferase family 39 protein [Paracoccus sp. SCSIO 75233]WBU54794.1 glycosyltransferase family 39 protein [Paracoccus sp. SCSIO 75233]
MSDAAISGSGFRDLSARRHLALSLAVITGITLWRIICLRLTPLDLFMDEAQYWLWGEELAFGYFSKPPLIGWVIRAFTTLGGDTAFWVRIAAPIGHGLAAIFVGLAARAWWQRPEAVWAGAAYATLPGVGVLSLFVSTDDLLLPAFAVALWAVIRLRQQPQNMAWGIVLGVALGLGLLAKYAMLYFVIALIPLALLGGEREVRRGVAVALMLALVIASPNLIWNMRAGFVTVGHTAENAGWAGIEWNWSGVAEFLAVQIVAFGPVFAAGYVPAIRAALRRGERFIVALSAAILAVVTLQALIRDANGNWAAPAFVAAAVVTVPWCLARWPRVTRAGMLVNLIFCLVLPATTLWPDQMRLGGQPVYARIEAVTAFNAQLTEAARTAGAGAIVSDDRMTLATLSWRLRDDDIGVYALPPDGPPRNHYEMIRPAPDEMGAVVLVTKSLPEECASQATPLPIRDAATQEDMRSVPDYLLPGSCW